MSKILNIQQSVIVNERYEDATLQHAKQFLSNSSTTYYEKSKNLCQYDYKGIGQNNRVHSVIEIKNRTFNYAKGMRYRTTIMGYNKYINFAKLKVKYPFIEHFYIVVKFTDKIAIYDFMNNIQFVNNDFYSTNDDYYVKNFTRIDRGVTKEHLHIDLSKFQVYDI